MTEDIEADSRVRMYHGTTLNDGEVTAKVTIDLTENAVYALLRAKQALFMQRGFSVAHVSHEIALLNDVLEELQTAKARNGLPTGTPPADNVRSQFKAAFSAKLDRAYTTIAAAIEKRDQTPASVTPFRREHS